MEPPITRRQSVRRCLFGKPNKDEVDAWLSKELEVIAKAKSEKWNFDFVADKPLSKDGDIEFERIPEAEVPHLYRPRKRCPRVLMQVASTSTTEPTGPVTRSYAKRDMSDETSPLKASNLKQAKLTNYLTVRKRRSLDSLNKRSPADLKAKRVEPPGSPFRFVAQGDELIFDSSSPTTSPSKTPVKRRNGRALVVNGILQTKRS